MFKGHAVAVIVETPNGIPLVRDSKKPPPVFWKYPGGRSDGIESARQCAVREIEEELGVKLKEEDLVVVFEEDRGTHIFTLFKAKLEAAPALKEKGNDGEDIGIFKAADILVMKDFFPNHLRLTQEVLKQIV